MHFEICAVDANSAGPKCPALAVVCRTVPLRRLQSGRWNVCSTVVRTSLLRQSKLCRSSSMPRQLADWPLRGEQLTFVQRNAQWHSRAEMVLGSANLTDCSLISCRMRTQLMDDRSGHVSAPQAASTNGCSRCVADGRFRLPHSSASSGAQATVFGRTGFRA